MARAGTHAIGSVRTTPHAVLLDDRHDDPLDAIRGILTCTLMSALMFWLPLALLVRGS